MCRSFSKPIIYPGTISQKSDSKIFVIFFETFCSGGRVALACGPQRHCQEREPHRVALGCAPQLHYWEGDLQTSPLRLNAWGTSGGSAARMHASRWRLLPRPPREDSRACCCAFACSARTCAAPTTIQPTCRCSFGTRPSTNATCRVRCNFSKQLRFTPAFC